MMQVLSTMFSTEILSPCQVSSCQAPPCQVPPCQAPPCQVPAIALLLTYARCMSAPDRAETRAPPRRPAVLQGERQMQLPRIDHRLVE